MREVAIERPRVIWPGHTNAQGGPGDNEYFPSARASELAPLPDIRGLRLVPLIDFHTVSAHPVERPPHTEEPGEVPDDNLITARETRRFRGRFPVGALAAAAIAGGFGVSSAVAEGVSVRSEGNTILNLGESGISYRAPYISNQAKALGETSPEGSVIAMGQRIISKNTLPENVNSEPAQEKQIISYVLCNGPKPRKLYKGVEGLASYCRQAHIFNTGVERCKEKKVRACATINRMYKNCKNKSNVICRDISVWWGEFREWLARKVNPNN